MPSEFTKCLIEILKHRHAMMPGIQVEITLRAKHHTWDSFEEEQQKTKRVQRFSLEM